MMEKNSITPPSYSGHYDEIIDCDNCAIIIGGALLFPPFYISYDENNISINGVRYFPFFSTYYRSAVASNNKLSGSDKYNTIECQRERDFLLSVEMELLPPLLEKADNGATTEEIKQLCEAILNEKKASYTNVTVESDRLSLTFLSNSCPSSVKKVLSLKRSKPNEKGITPVLRQLREYLSTGHLVLVDENPRYAYFEDLYFVLQYLQQPIDDKIIAFQLSLQGNIRLPDKQAFSLVANKKEIVNSCKERGLLE